MQETNGSPPERMMTSGQVARAFGVDPKTVTKWAQARKLKSIWTPGGHRRFFESEVRTYLDGTAAPVRARQGQGGVR